MGGGKILSLFPSTTVYFRLLFFLPLHQKQGKYKRATQPRAAPFSPLFLFFPRNYSEAGPTGGGVPPSLFFFFFFFPWPLGLGLLGSAGLRPVLFDPAFLRLGRVYAGQKQRTFLPFFLSWTHRNGELGYNFRPCPPSPFFLANRRKSIRVEARNVGNPGFPSPPFPLSFFSPFLAVGQKIVYGRRS